MSLVSVSPNQTSLFTVLGTFLTSILPNGVEVFQSQVNRVPQPKGNDFVLMTPMSRKRFETNTDFLNDCLFNASISGGILEVDSIVFGSIILPVTLFGPTVVPGTIIIQQLGGGDPIGQFAIGESAIGGGIPAAPIGQFAIGQSPIGQSGALASYQLSIVQDGPQGKYSCGTKLAYMPTEIGVQLDVFGPSSAENAQIISTLFRDEFAYDFIQGLNTDISPLHADDPRQMPFINDQAQYENRWMVEALLQVNETVTVPQQFADSVVIGLINVDERYPPS